MDASPQMLGLAVGLVIGLLDYLALTFIARRLKERAPQHDTTPEETRRVTGLIKTAAIGSLILFPLIGYFAGPYVFPGSLNGGGG